MKKLLLEFYKELLGVLARHNAIIDVVIEDGVYYTVAGVKHEGLTHYDEHFYKTKCAYEAVAARIYELEELENEKTTTD
jgi:hypothetical protein